MNMNERKLEKKNKIELNSKIQVKKVENFIDIIKKIPYAKLNIGIGALPSAEIGQFFSASAGVFIGNTIEINKGEIKGSQVKASIRGTAKIDVAGIPSVEIIADKTIEFKDNKINHPQIKDSIEPCVTINDCKVKNVLKEPKLIKHIYVNAGIVIFGEVGVNLVKGEEARSYLIDNWENFSMGVRKKIKESIMKSDLNG